MCPGHETNGEFAGDSQLLLPASLSAGTPVSTATAVSARMCRTSCSGQSAPPGGAATRAAPCGPIRFLMNEHYTKEELDQYRNGGMSILQKIGCSTHLKNCPACAKLLEELNADDQLLRDLRGSVELYQQLARKTNTRPAPKTT